MEDRAAGEITEEGHEDGNGGGRGNQSRSKGGADREGRAGERGAPRPLSLFVTSTPVRLVLRVVKPSPYLRRTDAATQVGRGEFHEGR